MSDPDDDELYAPLGALPPRPPVPSLIGVCAHCGAPDDAGDDWACFDVGMAPGHRVDSLTSVLRTELRDYLVCPACLASPWGAALRTILAHPGARHTVEYQRCTVLCMRVPSRKRRWLGGNLIGARAVVTCPSCWSAADVDYLDDAPGPNWLARWLIRILPEIRPQYPRSTH